MLRAIPVISLISKYVYEIVISTGREVGKLTLEERFNENVICRGPLED